METNTSGERLLTRFKSVGFSVWLAIFSAIALAPNTFFVSANITKTALGAMYENPPIWAAYFQGAFIAILFTFLLIYYTLRANEKMAKRFYAFEVATSFAYYGYALLFASNGDWAGVLWMIPAGLFAFTLPYAVKGIAAEILDQSNVSDSQAGEIARLELELSNVQQDYEELLDAAGEREVKLAEYLSLDKGDKIPHNPDLRVTQRRVGE